MYQKKIQKSEKNFEKLLDIFAKMCYNVFTNNTTRHCLEKEDLMGYESRVYIADVHDSGNFKYVEIIACVKMSQMWSEFHKLFKDELPVPFYPIDNSGHYYDPKTGIPIEADAGEIITDNYGDTPKCTDIDTVIQFLEEMESREHYRRSTMLLGLLKSIDPSEWDNIKIIHMGY